jgi:hypothetical protein
MSFNEVFLEPLGVLGAGKVREIGHNKPLIINIYARIE